MELNERLTTLKKQLAAATDLEHVQELKEDITRVRRAIMVDRELRGHLNSCSCGKCSACAAFETSQRTANVQDQEQWKFEAEQRLAKVAAE